MKIIQYSTIILLSFLMLVGSALAQDQAKTNIEPSKTPVPSVDGDVGECSLAVTVRDSHGQPVNRATVDLNAKYGGFFGRHELDLTVYTNADGKASFTGLPAKTDGVAYVRATSGALKGIAVYDPQNACENHHDMILTPGVGLDREPEKP
jgi:hypothetical protein